MINAIQIDVDIRGEGDPKNINIFYQIIFKSNHYFRFALDKLEQNKPESEDEIYEHVEPIQTAEDTDDEWNNIPAGYFDIFYIVFRF